MKRYLISLLMVLLCMQTVIGANQPTNINKPWTRWWWLGSAVDSTGIRSELQSLHDAGFGGVEITPLYGVQGEEHRNIDYLSPQWIRMLAYTLHLAEELGLGVDMNLGTGWPFGGPQITPELSAHQMVKQEIHADALLHDLPDHLLAIVVDTKTKSLLTKDFKTELAKLGNQKVTVWSVAGTEQHVKRAAPGANGLVMDHFNPKAVNQYLERFDTSITNHEFNALRAQFNDSYEVYHADWSPALLNAFLQLRGYDLRNHLDALTGMADAEIVARVKADYRETLSDMLLNNFTTKWTNWAHDRQCLTRNQAHGSPANLLDLYAAVDIPENEIYGPSGFPIPGLRTDADFPSHSSTPPDPLMLKFASSAANVSGKALVSCETFTWLGEHFRTALSQCKPEIDQLLCAGINHIFFHGTCYSPRDDEWPGWLFYASMQFAPVNTIWRDLPQMNQYIANCQNILQSAQPDNDILLYWPVHDLWHNIDGTMQQFMVHNLNEWLFRTDFYNIAKILNNQGHMFDYISDRQIAMLNADSTGLTINGQKYQTLIVPATQYMPLETLTKLVDLAEQGVPVLFHEHLPTDVPGLHHFQKRRKKLADLVKKGQQYKRSFITSKDLPATLDKLGLHRETLADSGLNFIRKQLNNMPVYFVSNLSDRNINGWVPFALQSEHVWLCKTLHDCPGSGYIQPIDEHRTDVYLQLEPGESIFLLFDFELNQEYLQFSKAGAPVPLQGPWELEFIAGGPELPKSTTLKTLCDWTQLKLDGIKTFAGTGKYRCEFDAPQPAASYWRLDLGDVRESARVYLNGKQIEILWALPFSTVIPAEDLKEHNVLEIEVTNLAANRIIDMDKRGVKWKKFHDINFVDLNYKPYDASGWDLQPSGLLGPVTLTPQKRLTLDKKNNMLPNQEN